MPPDLALLSNLTGSNYLFLKLILMVPKVFEPLKFDCILMHLSKFVSKPFLFSGINYVLVGKVFIP